MIYDFYLNEKKKRQFSFGWGKKPVLACNNNQFLMNDVDNFERKLLSFFAIFFSEWQKKIK